MHWLHLLFGIHGRFHRTRFWGLSVAAFVLSVLGLFLLDESDEALVRLAAAAALIVLSLAITITTGIRRLHDRDKSGWWVLLFYLLPAGLETIADEFAPGEWKIALYLIGGAISLAGLIELGFRRGTDGPNRFGDDPRATSSLPAAAQSVAAPMR